MDERSRAVLLDFEPGTFVPLAGPLRVLGLGISHAADEAALARELEAHGESLRVAFVPAGLAPPRLHAALDALAKHAPGAVVVAAGPRPDAHTREQLRAAGLTRALWLPADPAVLRFVVNEALAPPEARAGRGGVRVPASLAAHVAVGGRTKDVSTYSLSSRGAFLETARPSMRGARIALDLPLPDGPLRAMAKVVFTNVPGNLQRPSLPLGMGVRFEPLAPDDAARLHRFIEARADDVYV